MKQILGPPSAISLLVSTRRTTIRAITRCLLECCQDFSLLLDNFQESGVEKLISILRIFPSSSLLLRQEEVIELTKNLTQKLLAYWTDDLTAIEAVSLLRRHISYQSVKEMFGLWVQFSPICKCLARIEPFHLFEYVNCFNLQSFYKSIFIAS